MTYSTNYTNRASIFDTGDVIEGDHIRSIYDELGSNPGSIFEGIGVPYRSGWWWNAARDMSASPAVPAPGLLELWPMVLGQTISFDRISCYVTSAGGPSTIIRMGVYSSNSNGLAENLLAQVDQNGTVLNSSSFITGETISLTLDRGRYWVGAATMGTGSPTWPTVHRGTASMFSIPQVDTNFTTLLSNNAATMAVQLATSSIQTLPASLTTATYIVRATGFSIALRMM